MLSRYSFKEFVRKSLEADVQHTIKEVFGYKEKKPSKETSLYDLEEDGELEDFEDDFEDENDIENNIENEFENDNENSKSHYSPNKSPTITLKDLLKKFEDSEIDKKKENKTTTAEVSNIPESVPTHDEPPLKLKHILLLLPGGKIKENSDTVEIQVDSKITKNKQDYIVDENVIQKKQKKLLQMFDKFLPEELNRPLSPPSPSLLKKVLTKDKTELLFDIEPIERSIAVKRKMNNWEKLKAARKRKKQDLSWRKVIRKVLAKKAKEEQEQQERETSQQPVKVYSGLNRNRDQLKKEHLKALLRSIDEGQLAEKSPPPPVKRHVEHHVEKKLKIFKPYGQSKRKSKGEEFSSSGPLLVIEFQKLMLKAKPTTPKKKKKKKVIKSDEKIGQSIIPIPKRSIPKFRVR